MCSSKLPKVARDLNGDRRDGVVGSTRKESHSLRSQKTEEEVGRSSGGERALRKERRNCGPRKIKRGEESDKEEQRRLRRKSRTSQRFPLLNRRQTYTTGTRLDANSRVPSPTVVNFPTDRDTYMRIQNHGRPTGVRP